MELVTQRLQVVSVVGTIWIKKNTKIIPLPQDTDHCPRIISTKYGHLIVRERLEVSQAFFRTGLL